MWQERRTFNFLYKNNSMTKAIREADIVFDKVEILEIEAKNHCIPFGIK